MGGKGKKKKGTMYREMQKLCMVAKEKKDKNKKGRARLKRLKCNAKQSELRELALELCNGCDLFSVSKDVYVLWEMELIAKFYTADRPTTRRIPVNCSKAILSKQKHILVLDVCSSEVAALNSEGVEALPRGDADLKVQLWHAGEQRLGGVTLGPKDGYYKHPAFDVGGLTNLKQTFGTPFGSDEAVDGIVKTFETPDAEEIFEVWRQDHWDAKHQAELKHDLEQFLASVETLGLQFRLHLVRLTPEHRVVITAADAKRATGVYYVRKFGGDAFAQESTTRGLYAGITEHFVTPNLNAKNLDLEYVPY